MSAYTQARENESFRYLIFRKVYMTGLQSRLTASDWLCHDSWVQNMMDRLKGSQKVFRAEKLCYVRPLFIDATDRRRHMLTVRRQINGIL